MRVLVYLFESIMCSPASNKKVLFKLHKGFWDLIALKATSNVFSRQCIICCCLQFLECLEKSDNTWLKNTFLAVYRYTVIMFSNNRKWEKALDLLWPWKRLNIWQKHTARVIPDWNMFVGACMVKHLWHMCVSLPVICLSFFVSVRVWFGSAQRDLWPQKVDVGAKCAFTRSPCYLSPSESVEICSPVCVRVFCLFVTVNSEINTSKLYVTRSMQPDNNSFSLAQIHTYYCLAQSPGKELVDLWPTSEDGPLPYSLHAAQKDMFVSTKKYIYIYIWQFFGLSVLHPRVQLLRCTPTHSAAASLNQQGRERAH